MARKHTHHWTQPNTQTNTLVRQHSTQERIAHHPQYTFLTTPHLAYKHEELVTEATLDDSRLTDGQRILFEEEGVEVKSRTTAYSSAISTAYNSSSIGSSGYTSCTHICIN